MLKFNHYPPKEDGDISLTAYGATTLESYAANAELKGSIDPTYQRLRGAAEAIGSIASAASEGGNFDQVASMLNHAINESELNMTSGARDVLESHVRRVINNESGVAV